MIKCILLYIRYIIGRCKIEKKYKILRTPYFVIPFLSLRGAQRRGNLTIPLRHSYSLSVIANFWRKCGNLIIPLYFSFFAFVLFLPTFIAYTITIRYFYALIRCVAIPSSYISQYSPFFRHKNYKKTIFFIDITIFTI